MTTEDLHRLESELRGRIQRVLFDFLKDNAKDASPEDLQYVIHLSMVDMAAKSSVTYYDRFVKYPKDKVVTVLLEYFTGRIHRAYELRRKQLRLVKEDEHHR